MELLALEFWRALLEKGSDPLSLIGSFAEGAKQFGLLREALSQRMVQARPDRPEQRPDGEPTFRGDQIRKEHGLGVQLLG